MSGGGGRSDWTETRTPPTQGTSGTGGGGSSASDGCDIVSVTNLNSPVKSVIGILRAGEQLGVRLQAGPPRILQAINSAGLVAGSITSPEMPRIIACILQGVTFVADVVFVRGGTCQVRLHR